VTALSSPGVLSPFGASTWQRVAAACALGLSLALFVLACSMPALEWHGVGTDGAVFVWSGGYALAIGWLGVLAGQPAWGANPLLVIGWIVLAFSLRAGGYGSNRRLSMAALVCAMVALPLSAGTLLLFSHPILLGDSPDLFVVDQLRPGAYVWWLSMIALALGGGVGLWRET
jgi:hypothetical protein